MLEVGEVRFLEVTGVTSFGAFVRWGLQKDLLVPMAELIRDVHPGERHPIGLFLDRQGRPTGTMRISEMLQDGGEFELDEWVEGESWRKEPTIGVFVILKRRFVGLVSASEPNQLARGEAARFRVASILPDGKVELTLRRFVSEEIEGDAARTLAVLQKADTPQVGDDSPPEQIHELFGLSKKAFKRAVGRLLKQGDVTLDAEGFVVVTQR
ncbi:S1 RNA-binding domain-containing protein [Chondromyces crocatus]|uniref:Conserved virulence factor B-like winged helix domain-containing protein n=1 Tax=Chondromyces crocatus TaxID=52 RepID=A0A0K1ELK9_CHOCO|nr:S1 RNA-binding domain-containing protein [Chondromyces crocatus]AKT41775.1 uncharacterized protein CMC5_059860 [Chondromyces crocatus]